MEKAATSKTAGLVAWCFYDWANNAFTTLILTFIFAAYFIRRIAPDETLGSTLWGNAISIAGFLVAVLAPVCGAIMDQAGRRKPWLFVFTFTCIVATALLWFIRPGKTFIVPALILIAVANVGSQLAMMAYNAMLPQLTMQKRVGRWSGWGWALGYAGGLICLLVALFGFVDTESPWFGIPHAAAANVRATFLLAALWYAIFAIPLFIITPDTSTKGKSIARAAGDGFRQLRKSVLRIRQFAPIMRFLIAHMFYVDGLATVFVFGGIYAAGTFDMSEAEVLQFGIALNVSAGLGAGIFAWIDDAMGSRQTILLSLSGLIITTAIILLVENKTAFWIVGMTLGIFVGPVQAASRSYLARAAPESLRNEMFGLYTLSGKATSFLGPLLVGWLTYISDSQRIGMSAILLLFILGGVLMYTVPPAPEAEQKISG